MAQYELLLPKMGESVAEATIIKWVKQPGDKIELDDTILEIATDKVDSEVPSPVSGVLVKHLYNVDDIAQVGDVIAIIETEGDQDDKPQVFEDSIPESSTPPSQDEEVPFVPNLNTASAVSTIQEPDEAGEQSHKFYSPLVKSIAAQEGITAQQLDAIPGTGAEGRLTKDDLLKYLADIKQGDFKKVEMAIQPPPPKSAAEPTKGISSTSLSNGDEIIEMDRMRKLIADHMVMSTSTSPHVTSFVEADVTNLVLWRDKVKGPFEKREKEKITFTPIFIEAVAKAIKDFPMINVSVNGSQIIKKRDINIGMAAALPNGNLIVPVIKNADQLNLVGLTKSVNDLAGRARNAKLKPDETQNGTFTLTNVGSFGNITGTPIINQPQVAILAVGEIKKKPAVLETEYGDVIAIRHLMILSLSYDHRVVDGALGGSFARRVADYLENWDVNREI